MWVGQWAHKSLELQTIFLPELTQYSLLLLEEILDIYLILKVDLCVGAYVGQWVQKSLSYKQL